MNQCEQLVFERVRQAISEIDGKVIEDIYAISFYLDERYQAWPQPVLTIGLGLESNWRATLSKASNPCEARWKFGNWGQEAIGIFGESDDDLAVTAALGDELGCKVSEEDFNVDVVRYFQDVERLVDVFGDRCVKVAETLHDAGVVNRAFGRPVPIVFKALEYRDQYFEWTALANPAGLARDFLSCQQQFVPISRKYKNIANLTERRLDRMFNVVEDDSIRTMWVQSVQRISEDALNACIFDLAHSERTCSLAYDLAWAIAPMAQTTVDLVLAGLNDENPNICSSAIVFLGKHPIENAVDAIQAKLQQFLDKPDTGLAAVFFALNALHPFATKYSIPLLERLAIRYSGQQYVHKNKYEDVGHLARVILSKI